MHLLYKLKYPVSFLYGMAMAAFLIFLLDLSFTFWSVLFSQAFFISNAATALFFISFIIESEVERVTTFRVEEMELASNILVQNVQNIKVATFSLKSDRYSIKLDLETKKGISGHVYNSLNIDSLMIKPHKKYKVGLKINHGMIKNKELFHLIHPLKIEYYFLDEAFYSFKVDHLLQKPFKP